MLRVGVAHCNCKTPALAVRSAASYFDKCVQCHGGQRVAPGDIGRSMQPLPGSLVDASQHWRPKVLSWISRNGTEMSGMPAWQHRLPDNNLWALVAFCSACLHGRRPTSAGSSIWALRGSVRWRQ